MDPTAAATTKTSDGTTLAVVEALVEASEEEESDGCNGTSPQRRLDNALLSLRDGILLCLILASMGGAAAVAAAAGSMATVKMLMPVINVVADHWVGGFGGRQWQWCHNGGQQQRRCRSGGVHEGFLGG